MRLSKVLYFPALAALLVLGACESPAAYQPRTADNGTGYADLQIASNRYRVSFTGNAATKREMVENYLLLHAAEVTLKAGYPAFLFDTRDTKANTTYHTEFTGWPGWRGRGWYWHNWGEESAYPVTRYEAYAEIVLLTAEQAKAEARALQAQEVLDHIGPMAASKAP
jgi:hypothetical protein